MDTALVETLLADVRARHGTARTLVVHPDTALEIRAQIEYLEALGVRGRVQHADVDLIVTFPYNRPYVEPGAWILT